MHINVHTYAQAYIHAFICILYVSDLIHIFTLSWLWSWYCVQCFVHYQPAQTD